MGGATWTVSGPQDDSQLPKHDGTVTLMRTVDGTAQGSRARLSPACSPFDKSILELNGLQAAAIVCFSSAGLCRTHSRFLFPTRFTAEGDPRAYLEAPIPQFPFTNPLFQQAKIEYNGTALTFSGMSSGNDIAFSVFVSPTRPAIHFNQVFREKQLSKTMVFHEKQLSETITSHPQLVVEDGQHRVWQKSEWLSPTRFITAVTCDQDVSPRTVVAEWGERDRLVETWTSAIRLNCPDENINAAIHWAKIRLCEAVSDAPTLGRVHTPGGGMYYSGVWCNDQAEYAVPILAMMGSSDCDEMRVAINSLRALAESFQTEAEVIPYSVEVDGGYIGHLDRGDAGMFAWGASLLVLTAASKEVTEELYPHIRFACQIIIRKMKECPEGIIPSESDELEGRFPTGNANLATNCISILALETAAEVSLDMEEQEDYETFTEAVGALREKVEEVFAVKDRRRYKYYDGCQVARGWACLTALAGLRHGRGAVEFTLTDMWVDDGVLTAKGSPEVWDRCTLYAIRAGFMVGSVELAASRLATLAKRRLTQGISAPFMVENNSEWAQLSAESGLFIRVITEGLLGIKVKHDKTMHLQPRCPSSWPFFSVDGLGFCNVILDFKIVNWDQCVELFVRSEKMSVSKVICSGEVLRLRALDGEGRLFLEVV